MHVKTTLRIGIGLIIWALIGVQLVRVWAGSHTERPTAVRQLQAYFFEDHFEVVLRFDRRLWRPKVGNPIIIDAINDQGHADLQTIGEVREIVHHDDGTTELVCWIFPHARHYIVAGSRFKAYAGPRNVQQVLDILMTPRIKQALEQRWNQFMRNHEDEVRRLLEPLAERAMDQYIDLIRPDLDAAVSRQEQRFLRLVERHYEESVKEELFPLLEEHGMPLFEEKMLPVLRRLGRDLFEKAPKGRFVWEGIVGMMPWERENRLEAAFEQWLREDGMPIIEEYRPELMQRAEEIGGELANNPEIRGLLEVALNQILSDPELGQIAKDIVSDAVLNNPKTGEFVRMFVQTPETQAVIRRITSLAERYGTAMVDSILLAEGEPKRINPDLARVLRAQILWKDDFWIKLEPPSTADHATEGAAMAARQPVFHRHVYEGEHAVLTYPR